MSLYLGKNFLINDIFRIFELNKSFISFRFLQKYRAPWTNDHCDLQWWLRLIYDDCDDSDDEQILIMTAMPIIVMVIVHSIFLRIFMYNCEGNTCKSGTITARLLPAVVNYKMTLLKTYACIVSKNFKKCFFTPLELPWKNSWCNHHCQATSIRLSLRRLYFTIKKFSACGNLAKPLPQ